MKSLKSKQYRFYGLKQSRQNISSTTDISDIYVNVYEVQGLQDNFL